MNIGKYYKYFLHDIYIFKLKEFIDNTDSDNDKLLLDLNFYICNNIYYEIENDKAYIPYFNHKKIEEISIKEIIHLLPDTNPDKINFLRKQRINKLLNSYLKIVI